MKAYGAVEPVGSLDNITPLRNNFGSSFRIVFVLGSLFAATVLVYINYSTIPISLDTRSASGQNENLIGDVLMVVSSSPEYGAYNDMLPYPFLDTAILAEPHRSVIFNITNSVNSGYYTWTYEGPIDQSTVSSITLSGTSSNLIKTDSNGVGVYNLNISEYLQSGLLTRVVVQQVIVRYIRRELSSLTDEDREDFLDAYFTLWDTNTIDGMTLYGEKYKSLYYFASLHNDGGANSECDEFHGGYGFVSNHLFLSSYLEQSLQLVNPKVALHYMDYTQYFSDASFDSHLSNQLDGGSWTTLLTSKFFGSSDPTTGQILDGRWANLVLPTINDQFFIDHDIDPDKTFFPVEEEAWLTKSSAHMTSPYGLLRSPWNYNPSPYVTRFNNVFLINDVSSVDSKVLHPYMGVTCSIYESFIRQQVRGQPYKTYLKDAEDDTHGLVHFSFGSAGGDYAQTQNDILRSQFNFTDSDIITITQLAQHFFKYYVVLAYSSKQETYPLNCTANPWQDGQLTTTKEPGQDGGPSCQCSDYYMESEDTLGELISDFFQKYNSESFQYSTVQKVLTMDFETRKQAMQVICGRMQFDGEMASSGAATDPLFWVAHGAVERLQQNILFANLLNDTDYPSSNQCSGHALDGTKAWLEGFYFMNSSIKSESLTNEVLSELADPRTSLYETMVSYVYDSSGYSWCDDSDWFV